jgi:hypothetical protein
MSPGGHLVCTALACGAVHALTGSIAFTAGVALGGVLIDVDHVVDYILFERRRELSPRAFLRHYAEQRHQHVVLLLHSYELMGALAALAWATGCVWLWGYLVGMALHLPLDIVFNGRRLSRNLVPFYSFAYRWRARFRSAALLGVTAPTPVPGGFWRSFFAEFFPAPPVRAVTPPVAGRARGAGTERRSPAA